MLSRQLFRRAALLSTYASTSSRLAAFSTAQDPSLGKPGLFVFGRRTSRVEKVYFILEELGLPYSTVQFESPPPKWYADVNPTGLVPALRDDGFLVTDSNTICAYLAHKYGQDRGMFPSDSQTLADALKWADFIEGYLATPRLNTCFHGFVNKMYPPSLGKPGCPSEEELDVALDKTSSAMAILDRHLQSQQKAGAKFMVGKDSTFTFVDAIAGSWLHRWMIHVDKYGPKLAPSKFQATADYYTALTKLGSFSRAIQ